MIMLDEGKGRYEEWRFSGRNGAFLELMVEVDILLCLFRVSV